MIEQFYTGLDSAGRVQFTPQFASFMRRAGLDGCAWARHAIDAALGARATDAAPSDGPPVSGQTRDQLLTQRYRALRSRLSGRGTDEAPEADRFALAAKQTIARGDQITRELIVARGDPHAYDREIERHFAWQREHWGERFPEASK